MSKIKISLRDLEQQLFDMGHTVDFELLEPTFSRGAFNEHGDRMWNAGTVHGYRLALMDIKFGRNVDESLQHLVDQEEKSTKEFVARWGDDIKNVRAKIKDKSYNRGHIDGYKSALREVIDKGNIDISGDL